MASQIIVDGKVYSVTNPGIGSTGRTELDFYSVNPQLRGQLPTYTAQEAQGIWGGILSNAGKNDAFGNDITGQTIHKDTLGSNFQSTIQNTLGGISNIIDPNSIATPNVPRLGTDPITGAAIPSSRTRDGKTVFISDPYTGKTTGSLDPKTYTSSQGTQVPQFSLTAGNLKQGVYNNENVKQLQGLLGITQDGDFGPLTSAAVKKFQSENGLTPDGIVGPATTAALAKRFGSSSGITSGSIPPPQTGDVGGGVPQGGGGFTPPSTTSGATYESYFGSLYSDMQNTRNNLESEYQRQLQEAERKIERLTNKQEDVLGEVEDLTQPFREDFENAERERLYINENFEANQKLVGELDSLLRSE